MRLAKTSRPFTPRAYAFTYEDLYQWRVVRRLSFQQIALKFGCDHTTVVNACKRLNVPKRGLISPSEPLNAIPAPKVAPDMIRIGGE